VKVPATIQKLRGGYYTPEPIASFLADWAIQDSTTRILEPSCGDGNILDATIQTFLRRGVSKAAIPQLIQGVEIDEDEANKTISRFANSDICLSEQIHVGDFFNFCREQLLLQSKFDAVVGNPPFIRYQNFQEEHRWIAFKIMEHAGLRPTRLTNAWVPFVVASTLLVKENGGRIAMVIPAELLQVNYASELRQFLADFYTQITLITFKKLVFESIQQEVVLLLGERNGNERTGIRTIELNSIDELRYHEHTDFSLSNLKLMDHSHEKWTQYFLENNEIDLLRQLRADERLTKAKKVIDVDVGIVTGLNEFFVLTQQQAKDKSLSYFTQPIVTRSGHLQGINFTGADLLANTDKQFPARILTIPNVSVENLPESLKQYIAYGESRDFHKGYKCRIRNKWYVVPSIWIPDAFMLRQIHHYPKIILNETKATCTDTIHRVRFVSKLPPKLVVSAFHNSLTFAFAEVSGRSYGGGVLELEPNEAETLPLPLKNAEKLDFDLINRFIIEDNIQEALNITDRFLLTEGLGLSEREVALLRNIWCKLRDRRINRKH
jgi:adenine-specific DNA-methyltransferase